MSLIVQIKTILFSFLYGIFFHFILDINYKYITRKGFFSIFFTLLFIVINVFIYFIFLRLINFGVFHIYEIFLIFCGYFFYSLLYRCVEKRYKKWYNVVDMVGE